MIQIPDNIRPYVDIVVKHHFWMLMALVPLFVLPLVFLSRGRLAAEITAARGQIDSRLKALQSVSGIQPHPNEAWSSDIDKATKRIKRDTLAEWRLFWDSQKPLRVWPASLGPDFVQKATALKPGGKLSRPFLERYQNGVRAVVRTLPARMGAAEMMLQGGANQPGMPGQPGTPMPEPGLERGRPGAAAGPAPLVQWSPEDQSRLYASFNWEKAPSTAQVVLAQEELWVYGLLCDSIARVNKSAAGAYNAPIPQVQQLAVGYPATEDNPGGAVGGGRIIVPLPAGQAGMAGGEFAAAPMPEMPMGESGVPGGLVPRPPHPRFGAVAAGPGGGMPMPGGEGGAPATSPDDALRNWIYVDFSGKPLMAADLATSLDAQLVHLVPFVIRAVVDERKLDALLVDLATSPVPIDVRQVRINAGAGGSGPMAAAPQMGMPGAFGPEFTGAPAGGGSGRTHDIVVELRGTVGLATPPDEKVLGLEPDAAEEEQQPEAVAEPAAADEKPADPAPAAEQPAEPAPEAAPPAEPAPAGGAAFLRELSARMKVAA